jgi:hypothetical protein
MRWRTMRRNANHAAPHAATAAPDPPDGARRSASVVIRDLDPLRSLISPDKAHSELIVDPDAVLSTPILSQGLELIPWRNPEGPQGNGSVQLVELPPRHGPHAFRTPAPGLPCIVSIEDVLRAAIME